MLSKHKLTQYRYQVCSCASRRCHVFRNAFLHLVGSEEFTRGRDVSKHPSFSYWTPPEWSCSLWALIGWRPGGSKNQPVMLLLGWSHSIAAVSGGARGLWRGSRASSPEDRLRASLCLKCTPLMTSLFPHGLTLLCQIRG